MASPFTFRTKPTGPHANFVTQCATCYCPITITNGRVDPHQCEPVTLADIRAALDNR